VRLALATFESWLLAGLLLAPAAVMLLLIGLDGDIGAVTAVAAGGGSLFYAAVVWLLGTGRRLRGALAEPGPAPPGARLEPRRRTAGRTVLKAGALLAGGALLVALGFLVGVTIVGGVGLVAAFTAARVQSWESAHVGRLARGRDGRLVVL